MSFFGFQISWVVFRRLALPPDSDVIEAVELSLKCLTHVFSWVPLTTAITSRHNKCYKTFFPGPVL
jgi:hypothetical protein